jgi:hypothetical protein
MLVLGIAVSIIGIGPWPGTTILATTQQLDSQTIKITVPMTANGQII